MKESYDEGLASHISLKSCGNCSNAVAEALTEGSTGGLLSSEITSFRAPTTWSEWEGNTRKQRYDYASCRAARRSLRTWHVWTSFTGIKWGWIKWGRAVAMPCNDRKKAKKKGLIVLKHPVWGSKTPF